MASAVKCLPQTSINEKEQNVSNDDELGDSSASASQGWIWKGRVRLGAHTAELGDWDPHEYTLLHEVRSFSRGNPFHV